ncbi:hypothetical protein Nepgr_018510 [Nepenthes gracilis]|uniref:Uncharacterized protein n=1 Tax=Nepenthes gracilis TaxID=150966 RepID=A0AAD3STQ3_NEPGR|nr:hypothetical protein Nepgr_018510 [Nepenthes gracilis]
MCMISMCLQMWKLELEQNIAISGTPNHMKATVCRATTASTWRLTSQPSLCQNWWSTRSDMIYAFSLNDAINHIMWWSSSKAICPSPLRFVEMSMHLYLMSPVGPPRLPCFPLLVSDCSSSVLEDSLPVASKGGVFKFNDFLSNYSQFIELTRDGWHSTISGHPMYRLAGKLKAMK